ncbi:MAG: methylmalonyl-CoA epimerase [Chitinophagales bacterium]|nr:methylmalonyl-CoA epimerase [Chitinophagales bacterium]
MKKIDHIGIAVNDLNTAEQLYNKLLNKQPFHEETMEAQHLKVLFYELEDTKVELISSLSEKSAIHKFLQKGDGMHHVCFEVEDIYAEMHRLKEEGFKLLSEQPYKGAMNKLVCFVHPKSANGVLIELCQKMK